MLTFLGPCMMQVASYFGAQSLHKYYNPFSNFPTESPKFVKVCMIEIMRGQYYLRTQKNKGTTDNFYVVLHWIQCEVVRGYL